MKAVILGKGLMLANIILGVYDAGADIVGVLRYEKTSDNPLSLFLKDTFNPEYDLTIIKELGIKQLNFKSANSKAFRDFLIKQNVDLLIIGTWKEKIKKEIFDVPSVCTVNLHPSLLPKYRGPNPYIQTILHGEKYSGITLHLVDKNYDTGAILAQEKIKIEMTDTAKELREKTVMQARELIYNFIKDLASTIVAPVTQVESNSSYYPNISGDEKMLDFSSQTSVEISRTIRALHPFLPSYITYKNKFFIVNPYKFKILNIDCCGYEAGDIIAKNSQDKSLTIVCKDKTAIEFEDLKLYKAKIFTSFYIKHFIFLQQFHDQA
jgi:methionyl-tRNA formyltransferase